MRRAARHRARRTGGRADRGAAACSVSNSGGQTTLAPVAKAAPLAAAQAAEAHGADTRGVIRGAETHVADAAAGTTRAADTASDGGRPGWPRRCACSASMAAGRRRGCGWPRRPRRFARCADLEGRRHPLMQPSPRIDENYTVRGISGRCRPARRCHRRAPCRSDRDLPGPAGHGSGRVRGRVSGRYLASLTMPLLLGGCGTVCRPHPAAAPPPPARADIVDRNGELLATTLDNPSLFRRHAPVLDAARAVQAIARCCRSLIRPRCTPS